jgi:hypothetical protein
MNRKLPIFAVLLTPAVFLFGDTPPLLCGATTGEGTIICCNQHVKVRGNWLGGDRKANCEEWARTNARARAELCKVQCLAKDVKERYCVKEDCKDNPKVPGSIYAGVPFARTRAQPSETSEVVGSPLYGRRLNYREVKTIDGTTWYNVVFPLHNAGWISEDEVFCELPPPPPPAPPAPPDHNCKKNPKVPGAMFSMNTQTGLGKVHSEPTADSQVISTEVNGMRMVYREVRENKEGKWFYVTRPARPPGWMKESDLVCNRPGESVPPRIVIPPQDFDLYQGTPAISSAGRG